MRTIMAVIALAALAAAAGCAPERGRDTDAPSAARSDSTAETFAELQARGAAAMGVDQYTSSHVFEPLPDGGRISLERDVDDPNGVAQIREHMEGIASAFTRGDFRLPGFVHAREVPGTETMAAHRTSISYLADSLPRGGQVRIRSSDPEAVRAIHEFLAFQRRDHRTADHDAMH